MPGAVPGAVSGTVSGTVLLTGATSGLGLELARLYASKGAPLVLVGRKPLSELDAFFTPKNYCQADLSQPGAVDVILEFLQHAQIDAPLLLIHNAGVGLYGDVEEHPGEEVEALLEVNLFAPIALTHALAARTKKVVFISSVVADVPAPEYAAYGSSKAALDAFARNLRLEARGAPEVQTIHPGAIRTEMHAKSGVPKGKFNIERFPSAEKVAEEVFRVIAGSRKDVTIGVNNKALRFAGTHLSGPLDRLMRYRAKRSEG